MPLPTEVEMAKRLGISRPMVREALTNMEAQGLIARRAHQGTFANVAADSIPFRIDQSYELTQMLEGAGFRVTVEVLEAGWSTLSPEEASDLGLAPGSDCFRVVKRWLANGTGVICAEDVVPAQRREVELSDDYPLTETIARLRGDVVEWESAKISARLLDATWQQRLRLSSPEPALAITLIGVSLHGERLYRAQEMHVEGGPEYGMVRRAGPAGLK